MNDPKVLILLGFLFLAAASPTPTPDISTITAADIQATIAHRNALNEQLIQQVLPSASSDVKASVAEAQNLQKQIDTLATQAAQVPVLQAEIKKAHSACWRNLLIGAGIGAALVIFGPILLKLVGGIGAI